MKKRRRKQTLREVAQEAYASQDMDACQRAARAALEEDPNDAEAHGLLSESLIGLGRAEEALVHARDSYRLAPGKASSRLRLGSALLATKDVAGALQTVRKAIDADRTSAGLHVILGGILLGTGDPAAAVDVLKEAIRESSVQDSHAGWWVRLRRRFRSWPTGYPPANMELAPAYEALGRIEDAIAEWQTVAEQAKDTGWHDADLCAAMASRAKREIERLSNLATGREA